MTVEPNFTETPNTIPWPPILLGLCLLGAYLLEQIVTLQTGQRSPEIALGLLAAAFSLDAWVFEVFRRHKTEMMPHKPANVLVTEGPFRYSRNPVYVGNVLIILGGAALTGSAWFLVAAIAFVFLVNHFAVLREERHLEARFGAEWTAYAAEVRRWV